MQKFVFILLTFGILFSCDLSAEQHKNSNGWFPFTIENNRLIININFNNHPTKAIIDSGSEINFINEDYVKKFAPNAISAGETTLKGMAHHQRANVYSSIPVKLFDQELTLTNIPAIKMKDDIAMILGAPLFWHKIIQIDYPNKQLRMLPSQSIDMNKFSNLKLRRQKSSILPAVNVEINDTPVWLTLSTGNQDGLLLSSNLVEQHQWITEKTQHETQRESLGIQKDFLSESFYLNNVVIGPYKLNHVQSSVPKANAKTQITKHKSELKTGTRLTNSVQVKGTLGYDVLKHFVLTIDYDSYKAHIFAP